MLQDNQPETKPSMNCGFCSYNYACKEYQEWLMIKKQKNGKPLPQKWELLPLSELIELFDYFHQRYWAANRTRKEMQGILTRRMQDEGIDQLGDYVLQHSYKTEWTPHALDVIQEWDGFEAMPSELQTELINNHKTRNAGSPYLRKVWK
jgi:hypothetical protein